MKGKKLVSGILAASMIFGGNVMSVLPSLGTVAAAADLYSGNFRYIVNNGSVTITGYAGSESTVTVPSTIDGKPVTAIGSGAFEWNTSMTTLKMSSGITAIGDYAFNGCTKLSSVTLPGTLTTVGSYAFNGCSALSALDIPSTVTSVKDWAFAYCTTLASVSVPANASVGDYAFYHCDKLASATIPSGVSSLGEFAFAECTSLKSISVPSSVTAIKKGTFYNCSALGSVTLPSTLTSICESAFSHIRSLTSVTIPDKVSVIGKNAFAFCPYLTSVTLPASLKEVSECMLFECTALEKITIPNSVTSIGNSAFDKCSMLSSVTLPIGLKTINQYAFADCLSLKTITIPDSVTSIGDNVFKNCRQFTSITYAGSEAMWKKITIGNNTEISKATVTYLVVDKPEPVSGFKVSATVSDAVRLGWTKHADASGYIIEQLNNGKWERVAKIGKTATTYRVEKLTPGTQYKFRIYAYKFVNSKAVYSASQYISAITNPTPVAGLKVGGTASDAVRLNWDKNDTADGYIIEQLKDDKWVRVKKITDNATLTYRIGKLSPAASYKFRVKTYKLIGSKASYGGEKTITAMTNATPVTGLKIGGTATDAVRLNWDKNADVAGYIVEQYKDGEWVRLEKIEKNTTTTYRAENLSPATSYKFRVKTYKFVDSKAVFSSYQNITGITASTPVTGLKVSAATKNSVTLSWTKNAAADGYIIQQYNGSAWVRVTKIEKNSTLSYTVTGLASAKSYNFRVQTYKFVGKTAVYSGYQTVTGKTN